ncbi:unnamed protein product [Ixodes pacificus]
MYHRACRCCCSFRYLYTFQTRFARGVAELWTHERRLTSCKREHILKTCLIAQRTKMAARSRRSTRSTECTL